MRFEDGRSTLSSLWLALPILAFSSPVKEPAKGSVRVFPHIVVPWLQPSHWPCLLLVTAFRVFLGVGVQPMVDTLFQGSLRPSWSKIMRTHDFSCPGGRSIAVPLRSPQSPRCLPRLPALPKRSPREAVKFTSQNKVVAKYWVHDLHSGRALFLTAVIFRNV